MNAESPTLDQEALREQLRAKMAEMGISQAELARRADVSSSSLSQWLGGRYPGDAAAIGAKLGRWLRSAGEGERLRGLAPARTRFLETPTAQRIWSMLRQAQSMPDIVSVAGAPGIGKTMSVTEYAQRYSPVWVVTLNPMQAAPFAVLCAIARVLGVRDTQARTIFESVGDRVRGADGLLVIDEAQHMRRQALDTLRSLFDQFGIGIGLVGSAGIHAGFAAAKSTDDFAQFHSRVGARKQFLAPAKADVEMILDGYGVRDAEERKYLAAVATKDLALRGLDKTVRMAALMAQGAGETLGLVHYRAAFASLRHADPER